MISPSFGANYKVDKPNSTISFTGKHAGQEFSGVFQEWDATINFDPKNLSDSKVSVVFKMDSIKTGNPMYDGTLPTADWFDVQKFPTAEFKSHHFSKTDSGFHVQGDLTIRGITKSIGFDFTLSGKTPTILNAKFPINRLHFDIGRGSDEKSEWVSEVIGITAKIIASQE
jgi:polyisoprenoid-binding protein YceI